MILDDQEKEWLKAIQNKKVTNVKSFIEMYCEISIYQGNGKYHWGGFVIDEKNMMIPPNENSFLIKLSSFIRLIEKLLNLGALNYSIKNVSSNELLPIFRKNGVGFIEVYALLKVYQGYTLIPNPVLGNLISNNFLTESEKRYYDEQKSRKTSQVLTIGIAFAAIIFQVVTALTLYFLESNREKELTNLSQELSYYNAVAQKKISASEDIIKYRQQALDWLHHYRLSQTNEDKKRLLEKWFLISDNMKVSNSVSLIYSHQPYNAIMNFDDMFRDVTINSFNNSLNDSLYQVKRKELGKLFQAIIDGLRENTVSDSAYVIYQSKQHLDTKRMNLK